MSAMQVEGLWTFIQTLALSNRNKQWLAEHLIESTKPVAADSAQKETEYILSSDAMRQIIKDGDRQIASGQGKAIKVENLWK